VKPLLGISIFVAVVYLGLCAALFFLQRSLLYLPQPRLPGESSATLSLPVNGAELLISVRAHEGPSAIVYFGGNGERVTDNLPSFSAAFPGRALYLMNYRGYGGSFGQPGEAVLVQDALALFDHVSAKHSDVIVMGRSLGSGVAIQLASQRPAVGLVLITPYASITELAVRQFPMFPVRWLIRDRYDSRRHAPLIKAPTLLLVAGQDQIVPRASTDALYAQFPPGVATLRVIPAVDHNSISATRMYTEALRMAVQ
jgi:pimeloyl-ACP methyl ester carboxylesterase